MTGSDVHFVVPSLQIILQAWKSPNHCKHHTSRTAGTTALDAVSEIEHVADGRIAMAPG